MTPRAGTARLGRNVWPAAGRGTLAALLILAAAGCTVKPSGSFGRTSDVGQNSRKATISEQSRLRQGGSFDKD